MKTRLLELEQIKSFERNPGLYSDVLSSALLQRASFDYAPADSRLRHLIAKENLVPRLIDAARANVRNAPAVYVKVALESFKGTLGFIQDDLPKAFAAVADAKLQSEFKKSTKKAATAVADYIKHLQRQKPGAEAAFAIGKQNYEAKLRYDEGIDIPVDTLLKIAYRELGNAQSEFRKVAAQIDARHDVKDVWAKIQAD